MKLRECCLEMKFSASNYSIHWFKNSIVASLARFRPKLLLKASNLFRTCLYLLLGGENFRAVFVRRRCKRAMPPFMGRERMHRGKAEENAYGERYRRTKSCSVVKQVTKKLFDFNVSFRWVFTLEIFQRKFLVHLEFSRLRQGKRKINPVWKLFATILWILRNSWEWWS